MGAVGLQSNFAQAFLNVFAGWWTEWTNVLPAGLRYSARLRNGEMVVDLCSLDGTPRPAGARRDVVLRVGSDQVLLRRLQLPNASARTLRKLVRFDLERISPVDPKRVAYDVRVVSRDRTKGHAIVELRIVRRDVLERAWAACRSLELRIGELRLPQQHQGRWLGYPVDMFATFRMAAWRWASPALAAVSVLLGTCNLAAAYWHELLIQQRIEADVEAESIRANAIRPVQNRIEGARREIAFYRRQRNAPLVAVLLTELSAELPDTAWVTKLELSTDTLRIQGSAKAVRELPRILDKAPHFSNARFRSPPMANGAGDTEMFDLSLDLAMPL